MGFLFHFSSLYSAPYIKLYVCWPFWISYLNFRAVLVLPKTVGSAQTHKSMSFIWTLWSTLYVYLWSERRKIRAVKIILCFITVPIKRRVQFPIGRRRKSLEIPLVCRILVPNTYSHHIYLSLTDTVFP